MSSVLAYLATQPVEAVLPKPNIAPAATLALFTFQSRVLALFTAPQATIQWETIRPA